MTNAQIINDILQSKSIPEWLPRIALTFTDKHNKPTTIDKLNSLFISNAVNQKKNQNFTVVHPFGSAALYWILISSIMALYEEDYSNPKVDFLNDLKVGDLVHFDNVLQRYQGVVDRNGVKQYGFSTGPVKKHSGCTTWIREEDLLGRLTPYKGHAKKAQTSYNRQKKEIMSHPLFTTLYDLEDEKPYIRSSVLIVTQKKSFVEDVKNLYICFQKAKQESETHFQKMLFSEAIPTAFYSAKDKFSRINPLGDTRPPILRICSNLGTALDLVNEQNEIKVVIVDGENRLVNRAWELKKLFEASNTVHKILLASSQVKLDFLKKLKRFGFISWIWDLPSIKLFASNGALHKKSLASTDAFQKESEILKNAAALEKNYIEIKYPSKEAKQNVTDFSEVLMQLKEHAQDSVHGSLVEQALIQAYTFRSNILSPLVYYRYSDNSLKETTTTAVSILETVEELKISVINESLKDLLGRLCLIARLLEKDFVKDDNPKFHQLDRMLKESTDNVAIIYRRSIEVMLAEGVWPKGRHIKLGDLRGESAFTGLLFTGWLGAAHYDFLECLAAPVHNYLFYPVESKICQILSQRRVLDELKLSPIEERSLFLNIAASDLGLLYPDAPKPDAVDGLMAALENKREFSLNKILEDVAFGSQLGGGHYDEAKGTVSAIPIMFEDDKIGYFTEGFIARTLDRMHDSVVRTHLRDLSEGDEILFVKESRRDIFEEMTDRLHQQFPELVTNALQWRKGLLTLLETVGRDESRLLGCLAEKGIKVEHITLKNWLYDPGMIAPLRLRELLDVLAVLLNDAEIVNNKKLIVNSCRMLRAKHNLLGRYLAREIIGSINKKDDSKQEILDLIRNCGDLKEHIEIAQVRLIGQDARPAPNYLANRLQEL